MNKNNSMVLGVGAAIALLVSLPLEWMTIHNAAMLFNGGFPDVAGLQGSPMGGMSVAVNGFNGSITLLLKLPIWLIVLFGVTGVLLAILNSQRVTSLPKAVPMLCLALSSAYVLLAFGTIILNSSASTAVGILVAMGGLVMGLKYAQKSSAATERDG